MSNLYNLEPQPTAKVILRTTSGDLELSLFAKQIPDASRNFLQHCLDGYYNNTIFHRLVPGFIIQGGDPTGSGAGGISAINDGEPFADEFHSRLKFNRRGLLGMANEGKDSNGSQFFFTLDATPELQGKHTMFGRVEGDTIYNLMKMADVEMNEGSERPMYPTRITAAEVLVNPYEDMVARVKDAPRTKEQDSKKAEVRKRKKPAGKNVLSFGADEGDTTDVPIVKKAKINHKLVSDSAEALERPTITEAPRPKKVEPRREIPFSIAPEVLPTGPQQVQRPGYQNDESDSASSPEPPARGVAKSSLEATMLEIEALKASMKRHVNSGPKEKQDKPRNALEAMIPSTSTRGRKRGKLGDEKGALDLFKAFKQRLEELPAGVDEPAISKTNGISTGEAGRSAGNTAGNDDDEALCDLHFIVNCQSCKSWENEQRDLDAEAEGEEDGTWMTHQLKFAKDTLGKDLEWKKKMEEIEVIDPREKSRAIREEQRKGRGKAGR